MTGCADPNEFEACWQSMVSKYGLEEHTWFTRLYSLKEKWATGLSKDFFSAGLLSSQRSESTNNAIGFNARKTTSLTEFFGIYKDTIKRWRTREQLDEFQCSKSRPASILPLTGLLKHASEVYTPSHFKNFEAEFLKSISTSSTIIFLDENMMVYDISCEGEGSCHVTFDGKNLLITCDCKKFEECGFLCCHCLRVLHMHSIQKIPDSYILKRWTRYAKSEIWENLSKEQQLSNNRTGSILWRHEMTRKYYNLVLKSEHCEEARKTLEDGYDRDCSVIHGVLSSRDSINQCNTSTDSSCSASNIVLDPTRSITKGRRQRIKGHSKKKKTTDASIQQKEFGSKTPNLHLF